MNGTMKVVYVDEALRVNLYFQTLHTYYNPHVVDNNQSISKSINTIYSNLYIKEDIGADGIAGW